MWTFSVVLESVAILPQIDHLTKVPTLPALPLSHLVALGLYRFFYVLNWVYRLFGGDGLWDLTAFFFGIIQTIIWADFLWVWYNRKQIKLPPNTSGSGLRSQEEGNASEGQQVDAGDMSKSFVLTHIITFTAFVEARFLGGRKIPGLSVSAYPDQNFGRQAEAGPYTDNHAAPPPAPEEAGDYVIRVPPTVASSTDLPSQSVEADTVQESNDSAFSTTSSGETSARSSGLPTAHLFAPQPAIDDDGFSVGSDDGTNPLMKGDKQ